MRTPRTLVSTLAVMSLVLAPAAALAQGHGNSGTHTPAVKAQGSSGPKTTAGSSGKKSGAPQTAKASTPKSPNHSTETSSSSSKKSGTAPRTSTVTNSTTTIDFPNTPLGQKLARNSAIRSKLETQLAALGYTGTVYQAAYGFKNQGQLEAALNNAQHNTTLSFEQLKVQMTGYKVAPDGTVLRANLNPDGTISFVDPSLATNPAPTKSLGQAKQTLTGQTTTSPAGQ
jgi:hypothetical protein